MTNLTNEVEAHEAQLEREAELHAAVLYLTTRFYPPLPAEYAQTMIDALAEVNSGNPDGLLILPEVAIIPSGAYRVPSGELVAPAGELVRVFRVEHLIDEEV